MFMTRSIKRSAGLATFLGASYTGVADIPGCNCCKLVSNSSQYSVNSNNKGEYYRKHVSSKPISKSKLKPKKIASLWFCQPFLDYS